MQMQQVRGAATNIFDIVNYGEKKELATVIEYHDTDVVTFTPSKIILNTGGWRTATTKTRMNQASNEFGLGFRVYQKNGAWFVQLPNGDISKYIGDIKEIVR